MRVSEGLVRLVRSVLVVTGMVTGACAGGAVAPLEVAPGQPVQLVVGEAVAISQTSLVVRFVGANDSRCPSDVVCIQAGDAAIVILSTGAGPARTDTLYLARQPKSASYGGYRIEPVDLRPYPKSSGTSPPQVLTLRVTRGT